MSNYGLERTGSKDKGVVKNDSELERLTARRYSSAEADYLASVSRGTTKSWVEGYGYRKAGHDLMVHPPVTPRATSQRGVSFLGLVEVTAIGRLKGVGFSLGRIRDIVERCQRVLDVERPLVTLRFKTDSRKIFVDQGSTLLEVARRQGQRAWSEVLAPFLKEIDYARDLSLAARWWPMGRDVPILVDPNFGYGLPVIAESGVRTESVLEQFRAGEPQVQIAKDFNISRDEVEQALQFELDRAA